MYHPNDRTGNVSSFTSFAGGNPLTLGSTSKNNAGAFFARSDATSSHIPLRYDPRISINVIFSPEQVDADPSSPILNAKSYVDLMRHI